MRRRRIIIEVDLPPNTDIPQWHKGLVPLIQNTLDNVVYIATEDVKEPDVIAGYRNRVYR
jgi:hypothetical protein